MYAVFKLQNIQHKLSEEKKITCHSCDISRLLGQNCNFLPGTYVLIFNQYFPNYGYYKTHMLNLMGNFSFAVYTYKR